MEENRQRAWANFHGEKAAKLSKLDDGGEDSCRIF
jgi:hypothetical protein